MYPKIMTARPHQSVVVANEEQERALPAEYGGLAGQEAGAEPIAVADLSKQELQALCDKRGLDYDSRWGAARLLELLGAA